VYPKISPQLTKTPKTHTPPNVKLFKVTKQYYPLSLIILSLFSYPNFYVPGTVIICCSIDTNDNPDHYSNYTLVSIKYKHKEQACTYLMFLPGLLFGQVVNLLLTSTSLQEEERQKCAH